MIFNARHLGKAIVAMVSFAFSSFSMYALSANDVNFARRVHTHLLNSEKKGGTKVGETLVSIIEGRCIGFTGNALGARLNMQKDEIAKRLRLHRHFGNDPKLLRAGEHFTRAPQFPSIFRTTELDSADKADQLAKDLVDYLLSSKVHLKVGALQMGHRANRFLLTADICGHGIPGLKLIPCYYNANPTTSSSYKLSSRVQMVVSAQTQFAGHNYAPNEQAIMITLFPDEPHYNICKCNRLFFLFMAVTVLIFSVYFLEKRLGEKVYVL